MNYHWQDALTQAVARNRQDAQHRYLQLATRGEAGWPANRTVVFRGFSEAGELQVVTDQRSGKVQEFAVDDRAEICWYFARTREQFRLRCRSEVVDPGSRRDAERLALWEKLSDAAREQFYWPHPGEPLGGDPVPVANPISTPDTFLLVLLRPERVDHLQLKPSPQQRRLSTRPDHGWECVDVNP